MTRLRDPLAYLAPQKDAAEWGELPAVAPTCSTCGLTNWTGRCWTCEPNPTPCVVCGEDVCDLIPEPDAEVPF